MSPYETVNVPLTFIHKLFCHVSNHKKVDSSVFVYLNFATDFALDFTVNVSFVLRSHRDRETDFSHLS